ncbi:unnamed protein product, partial [Iphiclides podalirius]
MLRSVTNDANKYAIVSIVTLDPMTQKAGHTLVHSKTTSKNCGNNNAGRIIHGAVTSQYVFVTSPSHPNLATSGRRRRNTAGRGEGRGEGRGGGGGSPRADPSAFTSDITRFGRRPANAEEIALQLGPCVIDARRRQRLQWQQPIENAHTKACCGADEEA